MTRLCASLLASVLLAPACDGESGAPPAADARPADGSERGSCYGNGTCNDGLVCLSDLCVAPPAAPPPATPPPAAQPPATSPVLPPPLPPAVAVDPVDPDPAEPPPAGDPPGPTDPYVGMHWLAVNRVGDSVRSGRAKVTRKDGRLFLSGRVEKGPFELALEGEVVPISDKEFDLQGMISGTPDMDWAGEPRKHRETRGTFRFRAKGARKYWRMYLVNGKDCVCGEGCGNDFCYIDVGFMK